MRLREAIVFFVITFGITWGCWLTAAARGASVETADGAVLLLLGVLGPAIAAVTLTLAKRDRGYFRRIIDVHRLRSRTTLALLLPPAVIALAVLIDLALGGAGGAWGPLALETAAAPLSVLPSLLFATLIPLVEEMGWRGYALDRLGERLGRVIATAILSAIWAVWHLPLFLIHGTYQASLGIGTVEFWLFIGGIVPVGFAMSWLYWATNRSILAVILLHAMVNLTGEAVDVTTTANAISVVLWAGVAVGIVGYWRTSRVRERGPIDVPGEL